MKVFGLKGGFLDFYQCTLGLPSEGRLNFPISTTAALSYSFGHLWVVWCSAAWCWWSAGPHHCCHRPVGWHAHWGSDWPRQHRLCLAQPVCWPAGTDTRTDEQTDRWRKRKVAVVKVFSRGDCGQVVWCVHHVDWYEVSEDRDLDRDWSWHTWSTLHQSDNNTTPAPTQHQWYTTTQLPHAGQERHHSTGNCIEVKHKRLVKEQFWSPRINQAYLTDQLKPDTHRTPRSRDGLKQSHIEQLLLNQDKITNNQPVVIISTYGKISVHQLLYTCVCDYKACHHSLPGPAPNIREGCNG